MSQEASGYLYGAIRVQVGNNIELSLEGSNLLNTTTVNQQQLGCNEFTVTMDCASTFHIQDLSASS